MVATVSGCANRVVVGTARGKVFGKLSYVLISDLGKRKVPVDFCIRGLSNIVELRQRPFSILPLRSVMKASAPRSDEPIDAKH